MGDLANFLRNETMVRINKLSIIKETDIKSVDTLFALFLILNGPSIHSIPVL